MEIIVISLLYLNLIMRKLALCPQKQEKCKSVYASMQSDQCICTCLSDRIIPLLNFLMQNFQVTFIRLGSSRLIS